MCSASMKQSDNDTAESIEEGPPRADGGSRLDDKKTSGVWVD